MSRLTIDYGIDLGTTNSAIALLKGTSIEVFKNALGAVCTPSAVWIDPKNRLHVGQGAKDRIEDDDANAAAEFKMLMGLQHAKTFARTAKKMTPPELSSWVLKGLKRDVQRANKEDIRAAVICIPADFDTPQSDATKKAAQLAGFVECPLLHEPVAAGLAYGFQSKKDNVYWLVYDLGGGTFDAAILQVRGGEMRVVNHGGDKRLGGKLFDWEIVEKLFIPHLLRQFPNLKDFHRGNQRWISALAKLKWWAEDAKIKLSQASSVPISIDNLCQDDRGQTVRFDYELQRHDLENLIEPYLLRSINIGKKVLSDARLGARDVERVILVGGPTQSPFLRQLLADPAQGFGIPIDSSVNPMTVVAQGAAIFAATQRLPADATIVPPKGTHVLELDYKPVGTDPEPFVGGQVIGDAGKSFEGYTIEFIHANPKVSWRSGKVMLGDEGKFMTSLWASPGANPFTIELCDESGEPVPVVPEGLTYTIGVVFTNPPLTHSLGVAMANNEVDVLFSKGTPLPCKGRTKHRTVKTVRKDQESELLTIPIVEGENERRADRNQLVGKVTIPGTKIRRDIPAGSEIEIMLEVDTDCQIKAKAFVDILDQEFKAVISYKDYHQRSQDPDHLRSEVTQEKNRLDEVRRKSTTLKDAKAEEALEKIRNEKMEQQVNTLFEASRGDPETAAACHERLVDLRSAIDEVEDALEWPVLCSEADEAMRLAREVSNKYGNAEDKQRVQNLDNEMQMLKSNRDSNGLRRKVKETDTLRFQILQTQPGFWLAMLENLETLRGTMRSPDKAEQLFRTGRQAANQGNVPALKGAVQQLIELLPAEERAKQGFGGDTTK